MAGFPAQKDLLDKFIKKKTIANVVRVLLPLYATYLIFLLSVIFLFLPQQERQLMNQKKEAIVQLADSAVSLLAEYEMRVREGDISSEKARKEASELLRNLRYGPEGKDYFWINDYHPFMIMHPYRPDLEGRDLTLFKDPAGNHPFVAMVEAVMGKGGGFVKYFWQWKDRPETVVPKLSYVKGFPAWKWIIGTGIYEDDIQQEIALLTRGFQRLFSGVLLFVVVLSLYISRQVFKMEEGRNQAEQARNLEEMRLKSILQLNQMAGRPLRDVADFALEEAIALTHSRAGYLAFVSESGAELTLYTWAGQVMVPPDLREQPLTYAVTETGLWAEAVRARAPVVINDYPAYKGPGKKGLPSGHVRMERLLSIPVFESGAVVMVAGVGNKETAYDESDTRQLQLLMEGLWKSIEKGRAEKQVRESEARYRILAENATDMIATLDVQTWAITYVSPAVETILGYAPQAFTEMSLKRIISKASYTEVAATIARELAQDSVPGIDPNRRHVIELEMIRRDGVALWCEVTARFLRDRDGRPDRILGITRDVSQRKALEEQLKAINTDLCMAQKIAGVGNWSFDTETQERFWSEEVFRIYERDPLKGPRTLDEQKAFFTPQTWARIEEAVSFAMSEGRPYDMELEMVAAPGRSRWIHAICNPEPKPGGRGFLLRGTVQDITVRRQMENRIRQAQKMEALGTLAGGIAHDFNNILSAMMGFTDLAKRKLEDRPEIRKKLDHVIAAGIRARELVKHILIFSREADVQRSAIKLSPLVKESLKFLRASLPPSIEIHQKICAENGVVMADPTQMHQVLMNLFTNAVHAMREKGGILSVSLDRADIAHGDIIGEEPLAPGRYLRLRVSDTGCGIPAEVLPKIFEPFFTTKPRGEGSGMGLATVYGIVREMGGAISAFSEITLGATFQVLIPDFGGAAEDPMETGPEPELTGSGRILIVDDEPGILAWTSQALSFFGYEVRTASESQKALEMFTADPQAIDVIITDLAMPGMSGLTLTQKIRQAGHQLPIILCTGFSGGITEADMAGYGLSGLIMKPMIANELAQTVGRVLSGERSGK